MAAFDVMQEEPWRIDKLRENFTYMREGLKSLGFELGHTQTAVIQSTFAKICARS